MTGINKLTEWWQDVTPERKRVMIVIGVFVIILGAASIFKKGSKQNTLQRVAPKLDISVVMPTRKEEGIQELRARVETLSTQLAQANTQAAQTKTEMAQFKETAKERESSQVTGLTRELDALKEDFKISKSDVLSGASGTGVKNLPLPSLPDPVKSENLGPPPAPPRPKIVVFGGLSPANVPATNPATPSTDKTASIKAGNSVTTTSIPGAPGGNTTTSPIHGVESNSGQALNGNSQGVSDRFMQYLPAGSIFQGVLLNGIDAPTASMSQKNPVPALMRIKSLAFLPNRVTQDIRECFIILSGYGNLSSERAKMRTEAISCVRNDGGVIESQIDGFAVDSDGKEGISGTLVTKQGALIARSLFAGFISGFSAMMKPTATSTLNTSPGNTQQWQMPDVSNAAMSGAMSGIGQAANDVSKFFLDTAKEMHPVVEVPSGTEVTVILVRGSSLMLNAFEKTSSLSRH